MPQPTPRVSQTKVPPLAAPARVSQTRVPGVSGVNLRATNPNISVVGGPNSQVKSFVAAIMPNFAKICIVLAVIAVIALASQILGDYVKTNPEWSRFWKSEPDYSIKDYTNQNTPEKEQPPTTGTPVEKDSSQ